MENITVITLEDVKIVVKTIKKSFAHFILNIKNIKWFSEALDVLEGWGMNTVFD